MIDASNNINEVIAYTAAVYAMSDIAYTAAVSLTLACSRIAYTATAVSLTLAVAVIAYTAAVYAMSDIAYTAAVSLTLAYF